MHQSNVCDLGAGFPGCFYFLRDGCFLVVHGYRYGSVRLQLVAVLIYEGDVVGKETEDVVLFALGLLLQLLCGGVVLGVQLLRLCFRVGVHIVMDFLFLNRGNGKGCALGDIAFLICGNPDGYLAVLVGQLHDGLLFQFFLRNVLFTFACLRFSCVGILCSGLSFFRFGLGLSFFRLGLGLSFFRRCLFGLRFRLSFLCVRYGILISVVRQDDFFLCRLRGCLFCPFRASGAHMFRSAHHDYHAKHDGNGSLQHFTFHGFLLPPRCLLHQVLRLSVSAVPARFGNSAPSSLLSR